MKCGGISKVQHCNYDPQVIIDSVAYVCKSPQAHLLAPITSKEQDILIYMLYRYTNMPSEKIGQVLGRNKITISNRLDKIRRSLREKNLEYSQQNVDDIRDCVQYMKVLKPKQREKQDDRHYRRKLVESAGIDFLEFIRWPLSEQKKWMKEHKEGYNVNKLLENTRRLASEPPTDIEPTD